MHAGGWAESRGLRPLCLSAVQALLAGIMWRIGRASEFACSLVIALLITVDPAQAQTRLVYGADRAFAPFEFQDAQGNARGFQIDLLHELERAGGLTFDIRQDDWRVVESAFRDGKIDVVAMTETRSRRAWALFARPHATPATGVYHRPDTRSPVALAELAGHVIAMEAGSEPMRHTRETFLAGDGFRFLLLPDLKAVFEAVRDGRADYAMAARAYGDDLLARRLVEGVDASKVSLRLQAYGFAVAPGNEALRQRLEALTGQLERDGRLEALRIKWLSSHHDAAVQAGLERRVMLENILLGGVIVLSIAAVAWLAWRLRNRQRRLRAERLRRQAAEGALTAARQKLDKAFTHHPDAMMVSSQGRLIEVNEAFCSMMRQPRDALIGRPVEDLPAFSESGVVALARRLLDERGLFENLAFDWHPEGGPRAYFLISGTRIESGATPEVLSVVREVSESLRGDIALREEFETLVATMRTRDQELAGQRARADASEEALQAFTDAVSHDLRAPLRAIGGFAGMLRGDLEDGDVEAAISNALKIENAVERMSSMLEGLTRLSRIGRAPLQRCEVDMNAEADAAWKLVTAGHDGQCVDFRVTTMPPASADPALVGQIWQNLLENAFKFTGRTDQPAVAVDAHAENAVVWYRIADNGAGFDMRGTQLLFEPFQRMHSRNEFAGTGVGLSVVRRIARAHGGDVRIRSSPGVGTVVEFSLAAVAAAG